MLLVGSAVVEEGEVITEMWLMHVDEILKSLLDGWTNVFHREDVGDGHVANDVSS